MLVDLAAVLRYPRLRAFYGLSEEQIYAYVQFLREASEAVILDVPLRVPMRDPKDIASASSRKITEGAFSLAAS